MLRLSFLLGLFFASTIFGAEPVVVASINVTTVSVYGTPKGKHGVYLTKFPEDSISFEVFSDGKMIERFWVRADRAKEFIRLLNELELPKIDWTTHIERVFRRVQEEIKQKAGKLEQGPVDGYEREIYISSERSSCHFRMWNPEYFIDRCAASDESIQKLKVVIDEISRIYGRHRIENPEQRPNQSPEPTVMSVTPRADARGAPATTVAHL